MRFPVLFAASALVCVSLAARADTFTFSFYNAPDLPYNPEHMGSGSFTAEETSAGVYLITGVSGTTDGEAITSLLPPGTSPVFGLNDNLLFVPQRATGIGYEYFDFGGVAYQLQDGTDINLYGTGYEEIHDIGVNEVGGRPLDTISIVPSATTPEPGTIALLGTGLVAIGLCRRKLSRTEV